MLLIADNKYLDNVSFFSYNVLLPRWPFPAFLMVLCVFMSLCVVVHMPSVALGVQKMTLDALRLEVKATVLSHLTWVLGTELSFSAVFLLS